MNWKEMTIEELSEMRDTLLVDIAKIKTQLEDTTATGRNSDHRWRRAASHALRMKGAEHQLVMSELGRRRRAAGQRNVQTDAERFKNFARVMLPREVYMQIANAAEAPELAVKLDDIDTATGDERR